MSDLPCEIIEQILLRLPARSILRFKLVCKEWRSFFSDPKFVKDHANNAALNQSYRHYSVITGWEISGDRHSIISQSIEYESLNSKTFEFCDQIHIPSILGSCNGLLLLTVYGMLSSRFKALLWNPLEGKKYKFLPHSEIDLAFETCFIGFGYTALTDDYKVVKHTRRRLQTEIYSLKTDSWKIIPGFPDIKILDNKLYQKNGTHIHGFVYWMIYDAQHTSTIIALDLTTMKFKLIGTPSNDGVNHNVRVDLVEVQGCLGMYRLGNYGDEILIWTWNEDGNKKGQWTKSLTIPWECQTITAELLVVKNNEALLHVNIEGFKKMVMYDSARMMFDDIPSGCVFERPDCMVETLVSP